MFGSKTDVSSAQGQSSAAINSSGWVVGGGSANGGGLTASTNAGGSIPKSAYFSMGAIIIAFVYFKYKKGR